MADDVLFLPDLRYPGDRLKVERCEPEEELRPVYLSVREGDGKERSVGLTLGQVAELVGFLATAISQEGAAHREEARALACRLARERP